MTIQPDSTLLSHATGSFLTAPGDAPPGRVAAALDRHRYVVVLKGDGAGDDVVSCLTAGAVVAAAEGGPDAVVRVHAPPCVVAAERTTFAEFCDGLSVTLLDLGAEAVVLLDDGRRISGVLPVEAVQRYLGSGAHVPEPSEMGPHGSSDDHLVHGLPGLPLARVLCREAGCGLVNSLAYFDPARPPYCRNPDDRHRLRTEA
ncbi:hypothetical protein ACIBIZ_31625 [Nonomuraea spiralis]|uniref:hypothetical protein n=1 Tax=Nonomuraea TaxID=83681 RepID=UPI000F7AA959|nr:hypothetical protein [Nonomuraea sp. WAC 01424]RSN05746.1 hypothetical protein DMB42_27825 [Nonomuraea sp. WAC 01424]